MILQLITLPLRATWRGAEFLLDGATRTLSLALDLTGHSGRETVRNDRASRPDPASASVRPAVGANQNGSAEASTPAEQRPAEAAPRPPVRPVEPTEPPAAQAAAGSAEPERARLHVDAEPELVAESADPGAAEGAGAQLTIDEPWPGYRRLKAEEIIDRLTVASSAEVAIVELYEATHKRRRTVLSALARRQGRSRE